MPAPQVQPLPPVAAAPASAGGRQPSGRLGGSPTRGRAAPVLRSRRARHVLLAGLAIFMVVNGALATRALYRAWAASDRGREAGGLGDTAVAVADDSVAAVMDSAAALKHAAGATVHTARAAGQAAGAAVGIVAPLAMHAARTAAQGMGAAAQGAGELAAATVDGSSLAANQTAARNDSAAGEEQARTESRPKRQARELPASHVANESNDACAQALRIPKVALLFLAHSNMSLEPAWRLWFQSVDGLLPLASVCDKGDAVLGEACKREAASALDQQHLFSVYIHTPPDVTGFAPGSLWDGHLIPHRIPTGWGNISLVEATRSLMREAFRDPLNQRFVLLSESDIPLYDPLTLYQQLLAEERSRVNACNHTSRHEWRWGDSMQTENMNRSHFRKSGQFIGLTRAHAAAVLADSEVFQAFARHCTLEWDERRNSIRDCIPDEHYFPTLLAVLGLEHETECDGWGVATQDWSKGGAHPKAYRPSEVTPALVRRVREPARCNSDAAHADAQHMFVDIRAMIRADQHDTCWQSRRFWHPMPGSCPLTARKFPASTAAAILQLFANSCGSDLHLLSTAHCAQAARTVPQPQA